MHPEGLQIGEEFIDVQREIVHDATVFSDVEAVNVGSTLSRMMRRSELQYNVIVSC